MSSFTKPLIIQKLPKTKLFKVYVAFEYHVGSEDSEEIISVPEGFITDLASIPWFVRWLISVVGKHAQAGTLHDFMYQKKLYLRVRCDEIFLESMCVLGVPKWKRLMMHRAVRLFGGIYWRKKRRKQ